eukprot:308822_1
MSEFKMCTSNLEHLGTMINMFQKTGVVAEPKESGGNGIEGAEVIAPVNVVKLESALEDVSDDDSFTSEDDEEVIDDADLAYFNIVQENDGGETIGLGKPANLESAPEDAVPHVAPEHDASGYYAFRPSTELVGLASQRDQTDGHAQLKRVRSLIGAPVCGSVIRGATAGGKG